MSSDLIASYCHGQGKGCQVLFGHARSLRDALECLIARADKIEEGIRRYNPRGYSLRKIVKLLTGEGRITWRSAELWL
jgi:hypothetical protein